MQALLAVTLGTNDAISIGVAALIATALIAAVKVNEKQGGRITAVETLKPQVKELKEHDDKATNERHALDKRVALLEQGSERSGVYRTPQ